MSPSLQLDKIDANAYFTICLRHIDSRSTPRTVAGSNYYSICHFLQLSVHTFLEIKWDWGTLTGRASPVSITCSATLVCPSFLLKMALCSWSADSSNTHEELNCRKLLLCHIRDNRAKSAILRCLYVSISALESDSNTYCPCLSLQQCFNME